MAEASQSLGRWLREKCEEEGLSLRQAATKTGLSHSTIYEIIRGAPASPQSIKKLAETFGGNGRLRLVLEDKLLTLGGYRSERLEEDTISEPLTRIMDRLSGFSERELKLIEQLIEQLADLFSKPKEGTINEPLARILDKLSGFSEGELKLIEQSVDLISKMERR